MSGEQAACPFALHVPPYITPVVPCTVEGLHVWHSSGDLWWRFDPALEVQSYPPRAEEVLPPAPPRIALGEPIDPTTAPAVCPTRFVTGACRCCAEVERLRAERDDLRDTDDVLRVDLALRDAEVAGLNLELERLRIVETASVGAHALLADAEAEREVLREGYHAAMAESGRLRVARDGAARAYDAVRAENERLRAELARLADVEDALVAAGERERAKVERLRALVGDAIDAGARNDGDAIDRIHREAGLKCQHCDCCTDSAACPPGECALAACPCGEDA